jgi:hypothetical protein
MHLGLGLAARAQVGDVATDDFVFAAELFALGARAKVEAALA